MNAHGDPPAAAFFVLDQGIRATDARYRDSGQYLPGPMRSGLDHTRRLAKRFRTPVGRCAYLAHQIERCRLRRLVLLLREEYSVAQQDAEIAAPELPPIELPEPKLAETAPDPLFDSRRSWPEQNRRLLPYKALDHGFGDV